MGEWISAYKKPKSIENSGLFNISPYANFIDDEKPGIQALKNIAPDLAPTQGNGTVGRDYEYKRLGTLSLLAGMDLLTGEIIPLVSDTHNSSDFIEWLQKLDAKYPEHDTIRLVLDNHSAHTSKETQKYRLSSYLHQSMVPG